MQAIQANSVITQQSSLIGSSAPVGGSMGSGTVGASGSTTMVGSSTSTTMTSINTHVSTMLGAIDPSLANNDILKFLVAMLIYEALFGEDSKDSAMQMLELLSGGAMLSMQMGSTSIQIDESSFMASSQQSTGTSSYVDQPETSQAGNGLDVVA